MFLIFVFIDFLVHYFYLSIPGIILCVVGIKFKQCLFIGLILMAMAMILSIINQLQICDNDDDNEEFQAYMNASKGPEGLSTVRKMVEEQIKEASSSDEES